MAKLGWIPDVPDLTEHAGRFVGDLVRRAGGTGVAGVALYRKNDHARANAKTNPYALKAHLPRTYLDGAVLKLPDGTPVIGLTLRYDRVDNFWFCLLHELAHVGRHMEGDGDVVFVEDMTLRDVEGEREDPKELQADE